MPLPATGSYRRQRLELTLMAAAVDRQRLLRGASLINTRTSCAPIVTFTFGFSAVRCQVCAVLASFQREDTDVATNMGVLAANVVAYLAAFYAILRIKYRV